MNQLKIISGIMGGLVILAGCAPSTGGHSIEGITNQPSKTEVWHDVLGAVNMVDDMREIMKVKVGEREVVAVLQWRRFDAQRDALQAVWYGDMGAPPPLYVADSLLVSMDGRGLMIPTSKTRYLCSQWMNANPRMGLYLRGTDLCVYVDVGDGSKAYTASYFINPNTGTFVAHRVENQKAFHKAVKRSL
jgi:hypothetical protein